MTRIARHALGALLLTVCAASAHQPGAPGSPLPTPSSQAAAPPATPVQPAAASQAAAPPPDAAQLLLFGSDVGLVFNPIKPDKAADFEALMAKLRTALQQSADPVRKQQAASWKILKAAEPGPGGAVLYVFLIEPPVLNADYTVSRLLAEAYPDQVAELWSKLRETYAAQMTRLSLQTLQVLPPASASTSTPK